MIALLALLAGCELVADDRVAPRLSRAETNFITPIGTLALDCRPAPPLVDLDPFDPDPSIWYGFAGGRYVRSDDQGASWTLVRSIHEGDKMGGDGTFGIEVVLSDDTWVAQRGNLDPFITRDGGQLFEPLEVFEDGAGLTVPTGPAERWAPIDVQNGLAWRQGLWFASSDGAQTWERVGATSWGRFERAIDFDGNRRLARHKDEPTGEDLFLIDADGTETRVAPHPGEGTPETWLSPHLTRFLDADRLFSVNTHLRVQSLATGQGDARPIAGGQFQPSSMVRLADGSYLVSGVVSSDASAFGRSTYFVVDPHTFAIEEVTLDIGGPALEVTFQGAVDHDDGTVTLLAVGTARDGLRRSSLCRVGDGIEPGYDTVIEGVPDDLAPGEVVIAALRDETIPDFGRFTLGPADQPTWVYDGLAYQAAPPADFIPNDGLIPPEFSPGRARFVFSDGAGRVTVFYDSPDGTITGQVQRGGLQTWEGIYTDAYVTRTDTLAGHTDFILSGTDRDLTRGLGIDGLYTEEFLPGTTFTLGRPRHGVMLDGLNGRYPESWEEPFAGCVETPVDPDCIVFGDRIVEDLVADSAGNLYLADRWHGTVWMHPAGAPGDEWEPVADGFINLRDLDLRERHGRVVVYALDHVLYAFTPEPGVVARWSSP